MYKRQLSSWAELSCEISVRICSGLFSTILLVFLWLRAFFSYGSVWNWTPCSPQLQWVYPVSVLWSTPFDWNFFEDDNLRRSGLNWEVRTAPLFLLECWGFSCSLPKEEIIIGMNTKLAWIPSSLFKKEALYWKATLMKTLCSTPGPVSYTHLDVYKRQP